MNLNIATNTKEALMTAESVISRLFALQAGAVAAVQQIAEGLQKMTEDVDAKNAETQALIKKLREAIALVDKSIDKEIDAGIDRHDAKAAQPAAKPAPQGCAPEGIAPPADQVPAPGAASTDVSTADESAAVAPQPEPEQEPEPEPEPLQLDPAPEQEPEPSFEEMQAKLLEVARALGNDAVSEILAAADAWSAADVPPWKRADVIDACEAALDEERLALPLDEEE